jgi:hypothetical protein
MAVISGQTPFSVPMPVDVKRRVVVKFRPVVRMPYSSDADERLGEHLGNAWAGLKATYPGIRLDPYFSTLSESTLRNSTQRKTRVEGAPLPANFTQYYGIECPPGVEPEVIARAISSLPAVEIAYVEAGPVPPPLNPADDPLSVSEAYLDAAPSGIDARYVWNSVDGSGIGFVDMEQGWTLSHEDLAAANITVISGVSQAYHGHGTAVLGEVVAVDNTRGGIGIAANASARVVSQWRTASTYNTAEAILSAANAMSYGDVLLLEAQTSYPGYSYVPVEVEQAVFDAIQYATSQGVIVVEAAGNGSVDLDTFMDASGKFILNRSSSDFRDSGAIMVGAASSAAPHQRLSFSNYGSRVDCFGWGENIRTCGDGWTGTATNAYTSSFGGTSGASPIVSGAALLLQSWRSSRGLTRYSPATMRTALGRTNTNTPSANPSVDRIGVMPNLKGIIDRQSRFLWMGPLAWAWMILVGALLITPGGTLCIKCGPQDPGYIGGVVVNVLAVVSIILGIAGLVNANRARAGR